MVFGLLAFLTENTNHYSSLDKNKQFKLEMHSNREKLLGTVEYFL